MCHRLHRPPAGHPSALTLPPPLLAQSHTLHRHPARRAAAASIAAAGTARSLLASACAESRALTFAWPLVPSVGVGARFGPFLLHPLSHTLLLPVLPVGPFGQAIPRTGPPRGPPAAPRVTLHTGPHHNPLAAFLLHSHLAPDSSPALPLAWPSAATVDALAAWPNTAVAAAIAPANLILAAFAGFIALAASHD